MRVWRGAPTPLGATWDGLGVNFAVYSAGAEAVTLVLFEGPDDPAGRELPLPERTGPIWHGYVPGLGPGQLYGYRVHGPYRPREGLRFNARKVLLDPYARAVGRPLRWHDSLYGYAVGHPDADLSFDDTDSAPYAPLGAVVDDAFAWGDDRPPRVPWEDTIVYETHVKGLTALHPDVPPHLRGTYLGVAAEPIVDHLTSLGITTVELLPVQAFVHDRRLVQHGLRNYWGYTPLAYFAPEPTYAAGGGLAAVREFKAMVRALHAAGLEVVLDVVYNHTGEGDHLGPTLAFRGFDNAAYYKLADDRRYYVDYTGTGNTLDAGNPYVLQLILDSLRYWVQQMHVDGFRFDLAPALTRTGRGLLLGEKLRIAPRLFSLDDIRIVSQRLVDKAQPVLGVEVFGRPVLALLVLGAGEELQPPRLIHVRGLGVDCDHARPLRGAFALRLQPRHDHRPDHPLPLHSDLALLGIVELAQVVTVGRLENVLARHEGLNSQFVRGVQIGQVHDLAVMESGDQPLQQPDELGVVAYGVAIAVEDLHATGLKEGVHRLLEVRFLLEPHVDGILGDAFLFNGQRLLLEFIEVLGRLGEASLG